MSIVYLKHPGDHVFGLNCLNIGSARPDVSQEDLAHERFIFHCIKLCYLFAIIKRSKWLLLKVNVHSSSNCVSNYEEWAGQVVCSGVRMDSALKVPEKVFWSRGMSPRGLACSQRGRQHIQGRLSLQHQRRARAKGQSCQCRSCSRTFKFISIQQKIMLRLSILKHAECMKNINIVQCCHTQRR